VLLNVFNDLLSGVAFSAVNCLGFRRMTTGRRRTGW